MNLKILFTAFVLVIIFQIFVITKNFKIIDSLEKKLIKLNSQNFEDEEKIQTLENKNELLNILKDYYIKHLEPYKIDIKIKNNLEDIIFEKKPLNLVSKSIEGIRYTSSKPFMYGINKEIPGSAYIDVFNDYIFLVSASGIVSYTKKNFGDNQLKFKQIKNNVDDFIGEEQFKKHRWFSIKDIKIIKNKLYISFTDEIYKDCWTTSVIVSDINFENLQFKKLKYNDQCVSSKNNIDNEFNAHQSGGRITEYDEENIILTIGEFRSRYLAQDTQSTFGKVIKINIKNLNIEVLSMGHRNPQGLYFDKKNNLIILTEHGPQGGDEINLNDLENKKTKNYGWPISSYGEHYGGKDYELNIKKYLKYPLLKSHVENNFIEPIKYFVPSIGISEISKIENADTYLLSSLRDRSIYTFKVLNKKDIDNFNRIQFGERIRDFAIVNDEVLFFLEETASIIVLKVKDVIR